MTEYAGITIIIDQGPLRRVINVPKADVVGLDLEYQPRRTFPHPAGLCSPFDPRPLHLLKFWPVGEYTIREEENPMHIAAPKLSAIEQSEADRFGIHDEDESEGVW